jgi:hypothetical protein
VLAMLPTSKRMLRMLIEAPEIRENAGLRARERVRMLYQWDSVATEVRGIYLQLMKASPGPANAFVEPALVEPYSDTDVAAQVVLASGPAAAGHDVT